MNKIKIDSNHILLGVFVLVAGILIGISVGSGGTFALEGGLTSTAASATSTNATSTNATSTNATSSNATSTNATSSNATSSNATSTNATATNATSANASRTDGILYLNSLSLSADTAKSGDKIYVTKETVGACNSGLSIHFTNDSSSFNVNVEDLNTKPYFVVPNNVISGNYHANVIFLLGLNSDNSTFGKLYSYKSIDPDADGKFDFPVNLKVVTDNAKTVTLDKLSIDKTEVKVGEKVGLNYTASDTLTNLRLYFKSANDSFNAVVLSLGEASYFQVPSTVKAGEYSLTRVVAMTRDASNVYDNKFSIRLVVSDNTEKTYIYNNSELSEEIVKSLYTDSSANEITINVDKSSIISEELFKAIIGTDKRLIINTSGNQLVFNGRDIKTTKAIDANMSTDITDGDANLANIVNNGIIVNFASNGNLPGNALVRLKVTDQMVDRFGNDRVYVYYYDNVDNGFNVIADGIKPTNGYYEFAINHNSKYVLSKTKLADSLILKEEDNNVVNFRQSDNKYLLMLSVALLLVLVVIVIILIAKNKKGKN